mmetsp:Transcript_14468/g.16412  ORF Transcript_14468/g.16412 Transcript_14468/m.16412 type:complete len:385 (-) Transcript_14468:143-1297(-)
MKSRFGRNSAIPELGEKAYKLDRVIGEGATGRVVLARSPDRSEDVAIKIVRVEQPEKEKNLPLFPWSRKRRRRVLRDSGGKEHAKVSVADVKHELEVWQKVSSATPFAIEINRFIDFKSEVWFVMRLCQPFPQFIHDYERTHKKLLPMRIIKEMYAGVFLALREMHRLGIMHKDVKDENILITENLVPKLTDFGISEYFLDDDGKRLELRTPSDTDLLAFGTYSTAPPESFVPDRQYNESADTYSLCLSMLTSRLNKVAYEEDYDDVYSLKRLYTGCVYRVHRHGIDEVELLYLRIACVVPYKYDSDNNSDPFDWDENRVAFQSFAQEHMGFDVSKRPTVSEACRHPYVKDTINRWETDFRMATNNLKQLIEDFSNDKSSEIWF